eukprot:9134136-Ditylum_brightwellii.AAC.1
MKELTIVTELKCSALCVQDTNKNWKKPGVYNGVNRNSMKSGKRTSLSCQTVLYAITPLIKQVQAPAGNNSGNN